MSLSREDKFHDLVRRVQACRRCPRMSASARVLGPGSGSTTARLMFIGEAPGRLGADASQVPFHGDRSGHNFEALLEQVGLSRYDIFVTNCVLCNPKSPEGNNATPTTLEVANCSRFLKEQIELVDPQIVVTLGAVALRATALVEPHSIGLASGVRKSFKWSGRQLIPAYHPGARAMARRSFANQLADYQFIAEQFRRGATKSKRRSSKPVTGRANKIGRVAAAIVERKEELSYFALHKLLFLAEVRHLDAYGERLSDAYIIRQKEGPYCVELNLARLPLLLPGVRLFMSGKAMMLRAPAQANMFGDAQESSGLSLKEIDTIERCLEKYGAMSDSKLKTMAYLTRPMRQILRREKAERINLFNAPILPLRCTPAAKI